MKKLFLVFLVVVNYMAVAQNTASKADDAARIAISGLVSDKLSSTLPAGVSSMLENKLNQIATSEGLGGSSVNPTFFITANVIPLSKDITATAPPMTALNLEVSLYIADFQNQIKYSSASISVKGVGQNETKAYIEAIKQINPNNPSVRRFVDIGKTKIMEYYNTRCDFIIKGAQGLVAQHKYEEAIFRLTSVPEVCKECYEKAIDAVEPVYKKFMERDCLVKLADARASFAASPNYDGAEKARLSLAQIDPDATCYGEAKAFTDSIRSRILFNDKREWDFMMKRYDSDQDIARQKIQAMKEVGTAYGQNQPKQQLIRNDPKDWLF